MADNDKPLVEQLDGKEPNPLNLPNPHHDTTAEEVLDVIEIRDAKGNLVWPKKSSD